jgi:hypothetical protein
MGQVLDGVPSEIRSADPRLSKPVTVRSSGQPLGFLLEEITKLTGITVTADDDAGSEPLYVFVREVPAGELLDSIWSLMSYRGALWKVRVKAAGDVRAYHFEMTREAKRLPWDLDDAEVAASLKELNALIEAANAPPAERSRRLMELKKWRYPEWEQYVELSNRVSERWEGFRVIDQAVPPSARWDWLKTGGTVSIPLTDAPSPARSYATGYINMAKKVLNDSGKTSIADGLQVPDRVEVSTWRSFNSPVRKVAISIAGIGAPALMGNLYTEDQLHSYWTERWTQPGDLLVSKSEGTPIGMISQELPENSRVHNFGLALSRVHQSTNISVLARMPARLNTGYPDTRSTVGELLALLASAKYPHKWRNGMMLVSNILSVYNVLYQVPVSVLRDLRERKESSGGVLTIQDVCALASKTTREQYDALVDQERVLQPTRRLYPMLAWLGSSPLVWNQVRSTAGVQLPMFGRMVMAEVAGITPTADFRLRLQTAAGASGSPKDLLYRFALVDGSGKTVWGVGFRLYAAPRPEKQPPQ